MTEKLRVSVMVNVPSEPRFYDVPDVRTGLILINAISEEHLKSSEVQSNIITLDKFNQEDDEWEDWQDKDYDDIRHYEINENFELIKTW